MTSTVDKQLHNKNPELHNDSGENSEKVTSFISTVDIDKRIDEILSEDRYLSASNVVEEEEPFFWRFNKDFKTEVKDSVKSLIREVAEEVLNMVGKYDNIEVWKYLEKSLGTKKNTK